MATVDGLMTVVSRSTPESNNEDGLMLLDRQTGDGRMRLNASLQANFAAMNATGYMMVNFTDGDGHTIVEANV